MSLISALITKVRYKISDTQSVNITDSELVVYFNEAYHIVRNLIKEYHPLMLATTQSGNLIIGTSTYDLTNNPIKIIECRVNKELMPVTSIDEIPDLTDTGNPRAFFIQGLKTIRFYPIPNSVLSYSVTYIPEATALTTASNTGFLLEMEDAMVDYVVIRSGMRDEADMNQESQTYTVFKDQIQNILQNLNPSYTRVRDYFLLDGIRRSDY